MERNRRLAVEFIGMFIFMFTVGMVSEKATGAGVLAPLAVGSVLMAMVYAGGPISGGHFNPAVSTGVLVRGKLSVDDWVAYVVSQVLAAVLAGLLVRAIGGAEHPAHVLGTGKALVAEFIFTFALVYTVLHVATAKATEGNSYFGLAIGFIVMVGAFSVGAISGAAFNPAIALGASVSGLLPWSHYWIYFFADLLGGVAAAFAFLYTRPEERVMAGPADRAPGERGRRGGALSGLGERGAGALSGLGGRSAGALRGMGGGRGAETRAPSRRSRARREPDQPFDEPREPTRRAPRLQDDDPFDEEREATRRFQVPQPDEPFGEFPDESYEEPPSPRRRRRIDPDQPYGEQRPPSRRRPPSDEPFDF